MSSLQANLDPLRYPIGQADSNPSPDSRAADIEAIRELPVRFAEAFKGLTSAQIETPYRPGGWTLRQLAHHVADSHMNARLRLKLALTEDWPTITPYEENLWARTTECSGPIEVPLALLVPLHALWIAKLEAIRPEDWTARGYDHPKMGRTSLAQMLALYSWHGRHHTAHALGLRSRTGW